MWKVSKCGDDYIFSRGASLALHCRGLFTTGPQRQTTVDIVMILCSLNHEF